MGKNNHYYDHNHQQKGGSVENNNINKIFFIGLGFGKLLAIAGGHKMQFKFSSS